MSKVIAHIDLNAFFVRAEEIKNPTLEGKTVAIGHSGRGGIVSTCSYEARKYGVHSGMPMFKAQELCKNLIVIEGDYNYYEVLSNEFISYIKSYTKIVEQASIDECYADFTEQVSHCDNVVDYFKSIQNGLLRKTGLKCSIGISTTKFLAKMASDLQKPLGLVILRKKDVPTYLFNNPVGTYFGIGAKSVPKLNAIGVKTIGDLYRGLKDKDSEVSKFYGGFSQGYIDNLEGNSSDSVEQIEEQPDSVSTRDTLPYDIDHVDALRPFLVSVFNSTFSRFKKMNLLCGGITISYRYTNLKTKTCAKKLDVPTDDKLVLQDILLKHFENTYHNESVRQIGVIFDYLSNKADANIQMSLFDYEYYENKDNTKQIIDELNKSINSQNAKLMRASELLKDK